MDLNCNSTVEVGHWPSSLCLRLACLPAPERLSQNQFYKSSLGCEHPGATTSRQNTPLGKYVLAKHNKHVFKSEDDNELVLSIIIIVIRSTHIVLHGQRFFDMKGHSYVAW